MCKCVDCACSIRDGLYYPCRLHESYLPEEIRNFMQENGRTFGSESHFTKYEIKQLKSQSMKQE